MHTQLSRIAFADSSNNVVSLINIMDGVDGAEQFGYSLEDTRDLIIDNGATNPVALGHTIELRCLRDSTHIAQLNTWIGAQTPVRISGYGVDGFVYCHDRVLLTWADEQAGQASVIRIKATVETAPGHDSNFRRNGGIFASRNLLSMYDRERGSVELMAGTILSGETASFIPRVFTAPTQALELSATPTITSNFTFLTDSGGSNYLFPFPGVVVSLSINTVTVSGTSYRINIVPRNAAGTSLADVSTGISSTGVTTVSHTLPINTHQISCRISVVVTGGAQDGDAITFNRPSLNIGSTRNYSRF